MRFLCLVALTLPCLGDGKIFPPAAFVRADTPSQRALIHWHDGMETLVVETTVRSEASELGWILPLPASPISIRPADPGLFPTLQTLFQPRVQTETHWEWLGGLVVGVAALLIRWGIQRKISFRWVDGIAVLGVLVILVSMLLPSLGKAKGGAFADSLGAATDVTVLSEVRAGVFDVVTLTATSADPLLEWLRTRGFSAPEDILPVVRDYLDRGWIFVTARVQNPTPGAVTPLHPLVFRFPTLQAIYPMRLTGVGADSLDCDLYVFGNGRAEAAGWQVRYCGAPDFSQRIPRSPAMSPFPLRIRNPELLSLVDGSIAATKLSAKLTARDMSHDVVVRWRPIQPKGQTLHTWTSAFSESLFYSAWILAAALVFGGIRGSQGSTPAPWFSSIDRWGGITALAACGIGVLALPKAPLGKVETIARRARADVQTAVNSLTADAYDLPAVQACLKLPLTADRSNAIPAIREALTHFLRTNVVPGAAATNTSPLINPFTGRPARVEASPGNINVEATDAGLDVVWYDFDGAPTYRFDLPVAARDR
jgi:hypothetical protein